MRKIIASQNDTGLWDVEELNAEGEVFEIMFDVDAESAEDAIERYKKED